MEIRIFQDGAYWVCIVNLGCFDYRVEHVDRDGAERMAMMAVREEMRRQGM